MGLVGYIKYIINFNFASLLLLVQYTVKFLVFSKLKIACVALVIFIGQGWSRQREEGQQQEGRGWWE
jgi:hypothetical protein